MDAWSSWVFVCRNCMSSADSLVLLLHPPMACDYAGDYAGDFSLTVRTFTWCETTTAELRECSAQCMTTMPPPANQRPLYCKWPIRALYSVYWPIRGAAHALWDVSVSARVHTAPCEPGLVTATHMWGPALSGVECAKWARSVKNACLHYHCDAYTLYCQDLIYLISF